MGHARFISSTVSNPHPEQHTSPGSSLALPGFGGSEGSVLLRVLGYRAYLNSRFPTCKNYTQLNYIHITYIYIYIYIYVHAGTVSMQVF